MKKNYRKPEMQIVWLSSSYSLLAGSPGGTTNESSDNPALAPEFFEFDEE